MTKEIVDFLKQKDRPSISNLLYTLCGAIGILCLLSLIAPFNISLNFIEKIGWEWNLNDKSLFVTITHYILLSHVVVLILRYLAVHIFKNKPNCTIRKIYTFAYSIDDTIELISAVFSLLFVIAVFLQIYNTGVLFISKKSILVYIIVTIKTFLFIFNCFKARNLKIINKVLEKYPDLD